MAESDFWDESYGRYRQSYCEEPSKENQDEWVAWDECHPWEFYLLQPQLNDVNHLNNDDGGIEEDIHPAVVNIPALTQYVSLEALHIDSTEIRDINFNELMRMIPSDEGNN